MNEIKKCSIAGVSFTLEYDAYNALNAYIDSLNATYKDDPAGEEIIADIEARIAELILSAQPADAIIARPLIENIIKQLGSASEIDEEHNERTEYQAETTDSNGNPRIPRRLYRDMQNRKLGGVCAGLANYFDTDPTWIRLAMFAPLLLTIFGSLGLHWLIWLVPFTSNLFGVFILGYIIMWFAVPPASSARQKLEMKGERITARSIRENTPPAAAIIEPERTLIANVVSVLGKILLIILKIFVVLLLIGLVLGTTVLGFVMLCSVPLFAFDFATGLAFLCFILVIIIPLIVLIYLSIMLLVTHKPSGRFLLATFIVWILILAGMTVSAIKSPVRLHDQIENAFESAFSNDSDKLYDAFDEDDIADFRSKIGEKYDPDAEAEIHENTLPENVTSKITFTVGDRTVNAITKGDRQVIFCGDKSDVDFCGESLRFNDGNTQFDIAKGRTVTMIMHDDGSASVLCDAKTVKCSTEVDESEAGPTVTCSFTIDGVQVRYSHGPAVDSAGITKEAISDIMGAAGDVVDAAKYVVGAAGSVVIGKDAAGAMQQTNEALQEASEELQQAGEQIQQAGEELQQSVQEME